MTRKVLMMKGIVASEGYAAGKAYIFKNQEITICRDTIEESQTKGELERFAEALEAARVQIEEIGKKAGTVLDGSDADVFKAHIAITQDRSLIKKVNKAIESDQMTADNAVDTVMKALIEKFSKMENPLIRERAADLQDVCDRLLRILTGAQNGSLESLPADTIIVAENLTPSDTVTMDIKNVAGIVSEIGGSTSHTAIFARSLGIPAVVGVTGAASEIQKGQIVYLDGEAGSVETGLTEEALKAFETAREAYDIKMQELLKYADAESVTQDGRHIEICANIGSFNDCSAAQKFGIEGIGLFRTEFLYMGSNDWPSEDDQFAEYKRVLEMMGKRPVIIRTLDIGGDKGLPYFDFEKEDNPFLGYRAIRLCLDRKTIFKTQLRAILRASVYGNVRIMYPMISSVEEVKAANKVLEEAKTELRAEGTDFNENVERGIMIETPASCIIADKIIKLVDFFSVGTNDLTQYTTAVDRGNKRLSYLADPYHPAVLRLIKHVADISHSAGKWTGICGELAGMDDFTEILVGLGVDELSMSAGSVIKVRKKVTETDAAKAETAASEVLELETSKDILEYVKNRG